MFTGFKVNNMANYNISIRFCNFKPVLSAGVNRLLHYRLLNQSEAGAFAVNSETGDLIALRSFDRESRADYWADVLVSDSGLPSLNSSSRIRIRIDDTNDHSPAFDCEPLTRGGTVLLGIVFYPFITYSTFSTVQYFSIYIVSKQSPMFIGSPSCRALCEGRVRFDLSVEEGRRSERERSLRQLRGRDADAGANGRVQFRLESETAFRSLSDVPIDAVLMEATQVRARSLKTSY